MANLPSWYRDFSVFAKGKLDSQEREVQIASLVGRHVAEKRRGTVDWSDVPAPRDTEPGDELWMRWIRSRARNLNLTRSSFSYGHSLLSGLDTNAKIVDFFDVRKKVAEPYKLEWTVPADILDALGALADEDMHRVHPTKIFYACQCRLCGEWVLSKGTQTGHRCRILAAADKAIKAAAVASSHSPTVSSPSPLPSASTAPPQASTLFNPSNGRLASSRNNHTAKNRQLEDTHIKLNEVTAEREPIFYPFQLFEHHEVDWGVGPDKLPRGWGREPTEYLLLEDPERLARLGYSSLSSLPSDLGSVYSTTAMVNQRGERKDPQRRRSFLIHQAFVKLSLRRRKDDPDCVDDCSYGNFKAMGAAAAEIVKFLPELDFDGTSPPSNYSPSFDFVRCGNAPPHQCRAAGIRLDEGPRGKTLDQRLHHSSGKASGEKQVAEIVHRFQSFLSLPLIAILLLHLAEWDFESANAARTQFVKANEKVGEGLRAELWTKGMRLK